MTEMEPLETITTASVDAWLKKHERKRLYVAVAPAPEGGGSSLVALGMLNTNDKRLVLMGRSKQGVVNQLVEWREKNGATMEGALASLPDEVSFYAVRVKHIHEALTAGWDGFHLVGEWGEHLASWLACTEPEAAQGYRA